MTVFELLISKIRALKGAMAISQANGKIKSVTKNDTDYILVIEDDMSFMAKDIVRCQRFTGSSLKSY